MADAYAPRVHEVMDHIRANLDGDLSLGALAAVAHFSPHHFHRVFRATTGETVADFTRRARLERAVALMRGAPSRTLTSIAAEVGFATPSDFSRVFRAVYGCPPSSWDRRSRLDGAHDVTAALRRGREPIAPSPPRLVHRPALRLAYVRVSDPWTGDHLAAGYRRLATWLAASGVRGAHLVGVSWESALVTPLERLVYDLGVTVGPAVGPTGEIGIHELPAATAVEIHCRSLPETALAWDHLFRSWLPSSGFEPADHPALKRFRRLPAVLDETAWDVDCSIALRRCRP